MMLFADFSHNFNYALAWTVVHSLWQAMAIAFISGVLLLAFRKSSSVFKYRILALSMISVVVVAALTFCIYFDFQKGFMEVIQLNKNDFMVVQNQNVGNIDPFDSASAKLSKQFFTKSNIIQYVNDHLYSILAIWLIGLAFSLLRLLGGLTYVFYLKSKMNFPVDAYWEATLDTLRKKINLSKHISILESALVRSPLVIGHFKPLILFPIGAINRLSEQEVEAILSHEIAHIMRNDYLINIIQNIIESLFYYHPAIWWLSSQLKNEREHCCDDVAIKMCGNSVAYAKSLVSVQEMVFYTPALAMAFAGKSPKKQLLIRIQRMLNQPKSSLNFTEKLIASTTVFIMIVFLGIAAKPLDIPTCLPDQTSLENEALSGGNDLFLKFTYQGILDSLKLNKSLKDGEYTYVDADQNLNVLLLIKNNYVLRFNINDLEVAGKDIPKFLKLINKVVENSEIPVTTFIINNPKASSQPLYSNTASYFGKNMITMIDNQGKKTEYYFNEKGGTKVIIFDEDKPLYITLNDKNNALLNGKISSVKELGDLGWTLTHKGLQPEGGFTNIKPWKDLPQKYVTYNVSPDDEHADETIKDDTKSPNDILSDSKNKGSHNVKKDTNDIKTSILGMSYSYSNTDIDETSLSGKQPKENENSSQDYNRPLHEKFDEWLESAMIEDGYTKLNDSYSYEWMDHKMTINRKKVKQADFNKYVKMYEQMIGQKVMKSFHKTAYFNKN